MVELKALNCRIHRMRMAAWMETNNNGELLQECSSSEEGEQMEGDGSVGYTGNSPLSSLPEDCVAKIVSLTSPRDACRLAAVSWEFKSAFESNTVWEQFLPPEITAMSVSSPLVYSTKKELYFRLSDSPILLNGGKMSFGINKLSGKKIYMLGARNLSIAWGDTPMHWKWTSLPESRFSEAAELLSVCWLDIRGKIRTRMLSRRTKYAAYLVFKLTDDWDGIDIRAKASVRFVGGECEDETNIVYLERPLARRERRTSAIYRLMRPIYQPPHRRRDGWKEIELGQFFNDEENEDGGEVEMRFMEIESLNWKRGLVVEGIELRPKEVYERKDCGCRSTKWCLNVI